MKVLDQIKNYADILRLTKLKNEPEVVLHQAQIDKPSYQEFALLLLQREVQHRRKTDLERRLKLARLPKDHNLDKYDFNMANGMSVPQLKQLRELLWLEQNYNLILMGPSGTGKTYVAAGLVNDAVKSGHKAYFITMEELVTVLKMKEMTSTALNTYNRLLKAHLVAIDDIMLFPIKKHEAVAFFNLINHLHEQTSVIITTNKSPQQWAEMLDDEVLATALLDRLLFKCEVVKLTGKSYRMENRKTIFEQ
ncbi:Chromosomal replication initiator protein DnaA [Salinivirga cyanobacteriivorans]|uniref:Chromosomal replication initiator protein DnaA n=1 Tax=Salinivirga cyanobacteriivorans TaxID=1307839 RepID=A0A0S2I4K2_9BACT|nr:IS21-like element helper ATPase IstB [Salinivirga cyanobacteriivorans]ALO14106.1 Chromosomal replication initiator protein DnaA [Salinivirga cyanobacteriivorans]ALO14629.1 Chromosomal replication initiator protein DnaA [Salinivirga cyanobacteriivorans]ALO16027.1 Chromosomal replication initiator protein DnaA [Salinivirga cyanobacteriivorans]ALO17265.1 Chromosomal replication initiator protein DnaA [Salinivirga cyanobacteriivorans]